MGKGGKRAQVKIEFCSMKMAQAQSMLQPIKINFIFSENGSRILGEHYIHQKIGRFLRELPILSLQLYTIKVST